MQLTRISSRNSVADSPAMAQSKHLANHIKLRDSKIHQQNLGLHPSHKDSYIKQILIENKQKQAKNN